MQRSLGFSLFCLALTGCGVVIPILTVAPNRAELKARTKPGFERLGRAERQGPEIYLAAKPGPTIALPAANQAHPSFNFSLHQCQITLNSTKEKNSPTLVTRGC